MKASSFMFWRLYIVVKLIFIDNIKNHGPGGQTSYAIKSEADPCFAKVVEGFDTVDRMHTLSVQPGGYNRLVHYVAIKNVTISPN